MGIESVLDVARTALRSQQAGIEITGHNIANVNTPEYSRQNPILTARDPAMYGGLLLGRGVNVDEVARVADEFVEKQLMQEKSSMASSEEMENYMKIFEGLFNENSDTSISTLLSDFWNSWQDISNSPSAVPERIALYESSSLLAEQFNSISNDLTQVERDLTSAISTGIGKINQISNEIASLNGQIVSLEANGTMANDLRDHRTALVSELSEYIDVKSFEQELGSLTVATAKGCILVNGNNSMDLELGGSDGARVQWENSSGATVDITDHITNGKLGGWLEMRDGIVAKYKLDLDAVAKELIWSVNQQHSQGAGLTEFSTVTGTYQASDTGAALDSSGLDYADKIVDGGFRLWLYDADGTLAGSTTIVVDADTTEIDDIATAINAIDAAKITATTVDDKLQISGVNNCTFTFSDDTSNVLAALGINTFFTGNTAGGMGIQDKIDLDKGFIAAAQVDNNVGPAVADTANTSTGTIVTSGRYTGSADVTYTIEIVASGDEAGAGAATFRWSDDNGATWTPAAGPYTDADYPNAQALGGDGVSITFIPGNYVANDTFTISVTADSSSYGTHVSGDNSNALAIADLQYTSMDISQWTCDRIDGNTEGNTTATIGDYYSAMVGSIGVTSSSISRAKDFSEVMANKLSSVRDSISAVSLDEEMANLIKFQHAYAAAAKLITVSDEMYVTLLDVK